jgi:signal transduction histidine kinase
MEWSLQWFREPGVLEQYRGYIVGAIGLILLQAALIAGLLIQRRNRRRAEEAKRVDEAALRQRHADARDLAGRLIAAQEAERARIARGLHDDVSQRLAGISIAISACKRRPEADTHPELLDVLNAVQRETIALAGDIRLLSHDLHPGALQHAGLVEAVRSHCQEFARQHGIEVAIRADDDLAVSEPGTALCLYRIVQEALRNIAKHAGARHVRVTAGRLGDEVQLTVADDGSGFELARAREQGRGLGLPSIEERVRLARGRVAIETAPGRGTTITVCVNAVPSADQELAGV